MNITEQEVKAIIVLINMFQFDNARWTVNGVDLTELKKWLENEGS